jgi:thiamine biosynthesis lipoprotein
VTVTARPGERTFAEATWRALGTYVQLGVAHGDRIVEARRRAQAVLADVDRTCSRFRADSDLTRANAAAGRRVRVDPLLVRAVEAALRAAAETDGLVDPTLGRSLVALGYDADLGEVRSRRDDPAAVPLPAVPDAWRAVETDPDGALLVPYGTALDLGATGKAFASDLLAADLAEAGIACIVSLGGDIAVGLPDHADDDDGTQGRGRTDAGPVEWPVTIAERPDDPPQQTVLLDRGGLATSSVVHRRWQRGGEGVHHLLDPRTGRPAEGGWRTVSVTAASAVEANTATTASVVLGPDAVEWLVERDLAARLVGRDGRVVHLAGWPVEGDLAAAVNR